MKARTAQFLMLLALPSMSSAEDSQALAMRLAGAIVSPEGLDLPSDDAARRKLWIFGRCLAQKSERGGILSKLPGSREDLLSGGFMGVFPGECGRGSWSENSAKFMRGVYAEYFLTLDFDFASGAARHPHDKLFSMPSDRERAAMNDPQRASVALVEFGTCVAKLDMPSVLRLVTTEVGSTGEDSAFASLTPALSACISPGATFKANPFKLRGYLAEGAYRLLSTNVDEAQTGAAAGKGDR